MRRFKRTCGLGLAVLMAFSSITTFAAGEKVKDNGQTDTSVVDTWNPEAYEDYLRNIVTDVQEDGGTVWQIKASVTSEGAQTVITVPEDGEYTFGISYNSASHKKSVISLAVKIDGNFLCEDTQALQLDRIYQDAKEIRTDGAGNEFAPEQVEFEQCALVYPVDADTLENYKVQLTKGEHSISIASLNDTLYVSDVILRAENPQASDEKVDKTLYYKGEPIIQEGEDNLWKNSSWLISQSDTGSCDVTPSSPVTNRINYVGGSNWKAAGEMITWHVEAPEDGYYQLGFSYRQGMAVNYSSFRRLLIDGVCPNNEAESVEFPYSNSWKKMSVTSAEHPVYLTKGVHTISLQVTLGDYYDVCKRLEKVVGELGELNLKMTMITGETVDINRTYDLFTYIPELETSLEANVKELKALEKEIDEISGGESSSYTLVLRNMSRVIQQMLDNKYTATRYKSDFYTNYSSLSVCFSDMKNMPLDIDQVILTEPENTAVFEANRGISSFFKQLGFSIRRFIGSFTKDYSSVSGTKDSEEKLTLWVNWGQDQARVLNSMIQADFTPKYDIDVEVQVVNATIVQAILSGDGPDLVLQQARTEPVNLAMRGALYDLKNFDDYEEVLERFADGAETPYYYQDGLYALPDTQTYNVMFYRKDILEELGIEVPTTWEEFNEAAEVILHNKLSVYLPYTQITTAGFVNTGVGGLTLFPTLLLQNNVSLYDESGQKTNLTTAEALGVFETWTDYYTEMKLPTEMDFYNRLRAGTCPLGITAYSTAVTMTTQATELEGLWGMACVPGTVGEDGSVNYTIAGGGTGCSILNMSDNKEAAWEFLKWWTSEETQTAYSTNLESVLGPLGRVMVSNTEALKALSWTDEEMNVILKARENVQELPEFPGGYQVSRSIDMAFYNVMNRNVNPKDIMTRWGEVADNEILRKWEQYVGNAQKDIEE